MLSSLVIMSIVLSVIKFQRTKIHSCLHGSINNLHDMVIRPTRCCDPYCLITLLIFNITGYIFARYTEVKYQIGLLYFDDWIWRTSNSIINVLQWKKITFQQYSLINRNANQHLHITFPCLNFCSMRKKINNKGIFNPFFILALYFQGPNSLFTTLLSFKSHSNTF